MSSRYDTEEIDLSTGRTDPADYYELRTTRQRLLFAQVPADCELHDGDREADGVPLERGDTDCAPQGTPGAHTWYISNPAGSGTLVVVLTDDPSLCLSDVGGADTLGGTDRLQGDLAPGTELGAAEERSAEVGVAGIESVTVRALLSGVIGHDERSTITRGVSALPRDVAVDEAGERGFVVYDDGSVEELDLSDRSSISSEDTLSLTDCADAAAAAYVAATDTLLVVGEHSGNSTGTFWAVDATTHGNMSEATVDDTGVGHPNGGFGADTAQAAPVTVIDGAVMTVENVAAWLVETDGSHSITVVSTRLTGTQNEPSGCAVDDQNDVAYIGLVGGIRSYDLSGGTLGGGQETTFGQSDRVMHLMVDPGDDRLLAQIGTGARIQDELALLLMDVSDRGNIEELDTLHLDEGNQLNTPALIPSTDLWYVQSWQAGFFHGSYSGGSLSQAANIDADLGDGQGGGSAAVIYEAQDGTTVVFGVSNQADAIGTLEQTSGDASVQVHPLLADGARAATGTPSPLDLPSDQEAMQTVDLSGESRIEVAVTGDSGDGGTLDFVDVGKTPA